MKYRKIKGTDKVDKTKSPVPTTLLNNSIKDLRLLMQYATMFRVDKILRQYLEVLL